MANLIDWTSDLSVGVPSFDEEHKVLVNYINELHAAMTAGKGSDALGKILGDLITYTGTHFAHEEAAFAKAQYADTAAHKAKHEALVKQVLGFQAEFKAGKTTLSLTLLKFLKDWLQTHIKDEDKRYGAHLTSKGIR